jgi:hypothetical protein
MLTKASAGKSVRAARRRALYSACVASRCARIVPKSLFLFGISVLTNAHVFAAGKVRPHEHRIVRWSAGKRGFGLEPTPTGPGVLERGLRGLLTANAGFG